MLLEVQALVAPAATAPRAAPPSASTTGASRCCSRCSTRRGGVDLLSRDVYVNATGGVRVAEPAADLGVALAIASSRLDLPLPRRRRRAAARSGSAARCGASRASSSRVREAARLGFRRILVPRASAPASASGAQLVPVDGVADAVAWLRAAASARSRARELPLTPASIRAFPRVLRFDARSRRG